MPGFDFFSSSNFTNISSTASDSFPAADGGYNLTAIVLSIAAISALLVMAGAGCIHARNKCKKEEKSARLPRMVAATPLPPASSIASSSHPSSSSSSSSAVKKKKKKKKNELQQAIEASFITYARDQKRTGAEKKPEHKPEQKDDLMGASAGAGSFASSSMLRQITFHAAVPGAARGLASIDEEEKPDDDALPAEQSASTRGGVTLTIS